MVEEGDSADEEVVMGAVRPHLAPSAAQVELLSQTDAAVIFPSGAHVVKIAMCVQVRGYLEEADSDSTTDL